MTDNIDYIQILQHYCDLNEIPYHNSRDSVVGYMIQYPTHHIQYQTPYGRVFELLSQLMTGQIDLAAMMNSGDITHPYTSWSAIAWDIQCIIQDAIIGTITSTWDITMITIS